ncbi:TetR/AcrR family transcriptional regulator [Prevotellaceae bacterium LCP21S3_C11]|uniref:TetR/AcrR family transcriptional regulator n=1 Tax=Segatella hominis TaxID=2518605 RepID=UPI001F22EE2F|nr:TetR/AcrR family transcriptional regulator [Segatella hominis]MBS7281828.1 TetR/AcrR family transcriptional regulator [Prevotella sp.]MCF2591211.1 TetR/AcrR family transcriptional regulator [Segatella hominis]
MVEINEYRKELKSRIIDYAMGEFYKRGVRAVKMDEISQGLHVSKRTVYEIFGDKEELLLAGLKIKSLEMREKLETYSCNVAHNVVDIIGYFYKLQMEVNSMVGVAFYEEIHRMPRVIEFFKQEHEREFADRVKFLKAGVEERLFRQDIDYSLTMELLSASMSEIMRNQIYKKYSMQQIFDNFFLVIIRGFCTERGAALLNKVIE